MSHIKKELRDLTTAAAIAGLALCPQAGETVKVTYQDIIHSPTYYSLPDHYKGLVTEYKKANRGGDALKTYYILEKMVSMKDATPAVKIHHAELHFQLWNNPEPLIRVTRKFPGYQAGKLALVHYHMARGEYRFLKYYKDFLMQGAPQNPDFAEMVFRMHVEEREFAEGHQALFQLVKSNPAHRELFQKVYRLAKTHNSPHLRQILRLGYENNPMDLDISLAYAHVLGNMEDALDVYLKTQRRHPGNMEVAQEGAALSLVSDNKDAAIYFLSRWHQLDPENVGPLYDIKRLAHPKKDRELLTRTLEKLAYMEPGNSVHRREIIQLRLSNRDVDGAIAASSRALADFPGDRGIQELAINTIASHRDPAILMNALIHVQSLDPTAHHAQYRLAQMYAEAGDTMRSMAYLQKALKNAPNNQRYIALLQSLKPGKDLSAADYSDKVSQLSLP